MRDVRNWMRDEGLGTRDWRRSWLRAALAVTAVVVTLQVRPGAQDRLKSMPGYEQFQKTNAATRGLGATLATTIASLFIAAAQAQKKRRR